MCNKGVATPAGIKQGFPANEKPAHTHQVLKGLVYIVTGRRGRKGGGDRR